MIRERRTYVIRNMDPNDRIHFRRCKPVLVDCERTYPPALTKQDFYRRFYAGEFGNHGPMWKTFDEYWGSGYNKPIAIRTLRRGGRCDYFIERDESRERYRSFLADGYRDEELNFSAQAPEQDKLLQGEVALSDRGIELFGSTSLEPMRVALATAGFHVHGLKAHSWLKSTMCANSWEWLNVLLERYPGHTIEFTTFRYPWGVLPRYSCVIWEVRRYMVLFITSVILTGIVA